MISAISSTERSFSNVNLAKKVNSRNLDSRNNNYSQLPDTFTNSKQASQITFTGNPLSVIKGGKKLAKTGESLLGSSGSKFGGKVRRLGEEATEAIGGAVRKLKGKEDLPKVKKPVIAATTNKYADKCAFDDATYNIEHGNLTDGQINAYKDVMDKATYDKYGIDLSSRKALEDLNFNVDHDISFGSSGFDGGDLDGGIMDGGGGDDGGLLDAILGAS